MKKILTVILLLGIIGLCGCSSIQNLKEEIPKNEQEVLDKVTEKLPAAVTEAITKFEDLELKTKLTKELPPGIEFSSSDNVKGYYNPLGKKLKMEVKLKDKKAITLSKKILDNVNIGDQYQKEFLKALNGEKVKSSSITIEGDYLKIDLSEK